MIRYRDVLKKKWVTWLLIVIIVLLPMPAIQYLKTFIVRNSVVNAYCYESWEDSDQTLAILKVRQDRKGARLKDAV